MFVLLDDSLRCGLMTFHHISVKHFTGRLSENAADARNDIICVSHGFHFSFMISLKRLSRYVAPVKSCCLFIFLSLGWNIWRLQGNTLYYFLYLYLGFSCGMRQWTISGDFQIYHERIMPWLCFSADGVCIFYMFILWSVSVSTVMVSREFRFHLSLLTLRIRILIQVFLYLFLSWFVFSAKFLGCFVPVSFNWSRHLHYLPWGHYPIHWQCSWI